MKDTAKALEIAMSKIGQNKPTLDKCVESAMEMAAWKQEQMIERVCNFLKTSNRGQLCNQIIKAMEESEL